MSMGSPRNTTINPRAAKSARYNASLCLSKNNEFLRTVERTEESFEDADDSIVEDVRRILNDVRTQYDQVHAEAEKREAELQRLREATRVAEQAKTARDEDRTKKEEGNKTLDEKYEETAQAIHEACTVKKVYTHMLARSEKEQAVVKEKMLLLERHYKRKMLESQQMGEEQERLISKGRQTAKEFHEVKEGFQSERIAREGAQRTMQAALAAKAHARETRADIEEWRHKVALDAANEAFSATAGRLRKLYAIEKLTGNMVHGITNEQVEQWEKKQNGLQQIREVTGLTDVIDIVHKFLNRNVESEQLKSSVKEAETRLAELRDKYTDLKRDTDGITFDPEAASRSRQLFLEVEAHDSTLNQTLKEYEQSRQRLQQSTLQLEHMKRWAGRLGNSLTISEDTMHPENAADALPAFFLHLQRNVENLISHIQKQISSGKVQRKNMGQISSKEYHEASRLLMDKDFVSKNCRVPASLDAGRPSSRTAQGEDDSSKSFQLDREKWKTECKDKISEATKRAEQLKKEQLKKKGATAPK